MRLGLRYVKGLGERAGRAVVDARRAGPFRSVRDLALRGGLARGELAALAAVGALDGLGGTRRANLWRAAAPVPGPLFAPLAAASPEAASPLRDMGVRERLAADYAGTGVTLGPHPMALARRALGRLGVTRAGDLAGRADGSHVRVAGSVIVRQRPETAKGFVFLSLEDETGIANVIVTPRLFARSRPVLVGAPYLLVDGVLQHQDGVVSVRAGRVQALADGAPGVPSHDFG